MSLILFLEKEMRSAASHKMSIGTEKGPHVDDDVVGIVIVACCCSLSKCMQ
jgi:hypothetical protein